MKFSVVSRSWNHAELMRVATLARIFPPTLIDYHTGPITLSLFKFRWESLLKGGWPHPPPPTIFSECSFRFIQRGKIGTFPSDSVPYLERIYKARCDYVSHRIKLSSILKSVFDIVKRWSIKTFTFFSKYLHNARNAISETPNSILFGGACPPDHPRIVIYNLLSCPPPQNKIALTLSNN